ncbi:IclR family transcriptional regulator [Methylocapsa sp. S129]|uniref:IclR family transcriptional regulator n=1 Tax=Methylocapsa sp. S129 TaxID=1641869 RepID=UPI001AED7CD8|nr:helix-turn-helix domain-containing protein [Methylocapsa sp. S129]
MNEVGAAGEKRRLYMLDRSARDVGSAKNPYGAEVAGAIKSAKRVLELLEYLAERRRPLGVSDIVRGLNYPQSSVSALLTSLVKLGYLDHDRHKRQFMPTMRVALLGGWVQDELYSEASLSRVVDELHAITGQTVILGMQNGIHVQYVHLVQALKPQVPHWYIKNGSLRPLCRSAVGKVLLSLKSDTEVVHLLRRINAEEPDPSKRVTSTALLRELDHIRTCGYAVTEGSVNPHAGVVAIEMQTSNRQTPMAIGIGATVAEIRAHRDSFLKAEGSRGTLQGRQAQIVDGGRADISDFAGITQLL